DLKLGTELQYLGTVRGRLGYVVTDPWLVYATGGWAYGRTKSSASFDSTIPFSFDASKKLDHSGWVVGVGSEFAVSPNVTIRGEY
ncbi:porin family protein, partial [Mycobacterium tuberculosis]|nr:porin family protein [Mycobacterium tuberculosis]